MPHRFLFSAYEQVFKTYPVRMSGNTCISLVLYIYLRSPCRHRQGLQPVSRCGTFTSNKLHGRLSRSDGVKLFLTLTANAQHVPRPCSTPTSSQPRSFPLVNRSGMSVGN